MSTADGSTVSSNLGGLSTLLPPLRKLVSTIYLFQLYIFGSNLGSSKGLKSVKHNFWSQKRKHSKILYFCHFQRLNSRRPYALYYFQFPNHSNTKFEFLIEWHVAKFSVCYGSTIHYRSVYWLEDLTFSIFF